MKRIDDTIMDQSFHRF